MSQPVYIFCFLLFVISVEAREINLVKNPGFETVDTSKKNPLGYGMEGAAFWGYLGGGEDFATNGIVFPGRTGAEGEVSQMVQGIDPSKGRWLTFRFRGLAESQFVVAGDALKIKMEFFSRKGTDSLDCASVDIYPEIELDRKNLNGNGNYGRYGAAVWRSYELEELMPFREVDAVKISVIYAKGASTAQFHAAFLIDDFSLIQRTASRTGRVDPAKRIPVVPGRMVDDNKLVALGGRWFYEPKAGESVAPSATTPLVVTEENADRLYYKSSRNMNPFLNNMTAWLLAGYKDAQGKVVEEDRFVPDNVVLVFKGDGFVTVKARNIPNHPTAKFPGFNPSSIQEGNNTYRLPLAPVPNPKAVAMAGPTQNSALPMGPIGIAVNGVVFFNPFDAGMMDASNIMDYCCGHPQQENIYHYHKYPICVNTPFTDKGDAHSEVIGFAFDGFPLYGPYEAAGIMAKDSTSNPLNPFNACYDPDRGWHYHVTPGKFPYLIGGFYGKVEPSNFERRFNRF